MRDGEEYVTGAIATVLLMLVIWCTLWLQSAPANAHDGFDKWCCNNSDCKIAEVTWLPDGRIEATHKDTGFSRVFDKNTKLRKLPPQVKNRSEWVACMTPNLQIQARCLYHPDLGM